MSRHNEHLANLDLSARAEEAARWQRVLGAKPGQARRPAPKARRGWVLDATFAVSLGLALAWLLFWGLSK